MEELDPDNATSTLMQFLNDLSSHPLPPEVAYTSIGGLGGGSLPSLGDGIVIAASQNLANVDRFPRSLQHRARTVEVALCHGFRDLVFREVHTCETKDPDVWDEILGALRIRVNLERFPAEFVPLRDGDPGTPGDGIIIASAAPEFHLQDPVRLHLLTSGLTLSVYSPNFPQQFRIIFGVVFARPGFEPFDPCSFASRGEAVLGSQINGVWGVARNVTRNEAEDIVRVIRTTKPGCESVVVNEYAVSGFSLLEEIQTLAIDSIDAVALGFGRNNIPGLRRR